MIIGLTGRNAAGKGTVAAWLQARGFGYLSLSDAIRAYIRAQGHEPTRDRLIAAGRAMRAAGGAGVLAEQTLAQIPPGTDFIVDSVRNPAEVEVLRRVPGFVLVEVHAAEQTRYQRLSERARAGDASTFDEFRRQEGAELHSGDLSAQQLLATAALADEVVRNDDGVEVLEGELTALLARLQREAGTTKAP